MPGEITTIVGANGAGKSALGYWLDAHSSGVAKRLVAHRRLWFPNAGPDLSPAQRERTGSNIQTWNRQEESRFLDHADAQRAGIVLFDLLAKLNAENARMVAIFREGATPARVESEIGLPILDRLNVILQRAGLAVTLLLTDKQTFDTVNARSRVAYPINRMSDGEKSAVLLAGEIISSPPARVFIIDEPERHLHRSISAGLVDAVIADRPDCHFVVLTHDLDLASTLSRRPGQTLTLAGCDWTGEAPTGWDLKEVDPDSNLPESARRAILGGRRELLFAEGEAHSLDKSLYELLFPALSVFPAGGADQVIKAVTGLRSSADHHWVNAYGVVDGDGRDEAERASLLRRGIVSLRVSEVENLYYSDDALRSVAMARAELVGGSADTLYERARALALDVLADNATLDRLAGGLALAALRRTMVDSIPSKFGGQQDPIEVQIPSPYPEIRGKLENMAVERDYPGLLALLPVRDTALPSRVSTMLGFQRPADYEAAVRVRVARERELAESLRNAIGALPPL
ncbi:ABC-type lipoprotein export system ATPase subunit [Georgenia muralis]|uniref:ABC-type lipoprotein export system ATPase subunit n=2 Tax=Georgenia muralis TaxID=154117 RepID=A0A3N5AAD1_9MICO|nr:ABC-type lipoprotein export system ATPase subunit [Georgenia muralis]